MGIYHPSGITVEVVGIEAGGNGRLCFQHDVCGSESDDYVVVWLRKVQIMNSSGREETAIAAEYLVSDGIDQFRVGFLQRHFVPHARSFDGILEQVSELYSITSDRPIKRKKCQHNMGCCLPAIISKFPAPAANTLSSDGTSISSFLARIARLDEDDEEDKRLLQEMDKAIITYVDPLNTLKKLKTQN